LFDTFLIPGAVALAVSYGMQPVLIRMLPRMGLVDIPNHRSSHSTPTPRGGGIGVACGAVGALAVAAATGWSAGPEAAGVAAALVILFLTGFVDDVRALPALARVLVMFCGGALVAGPTNRWWLVVLAAVWFAACTNAVNFMDGINGITGATATVAGGWYLWQGIDRVDDLVVLLGVVVAGSALGFLPYNAPRARIFLGDGGSYLVGGALAACAFLLWRDGAPVLVALAPLVPYLADTSATLVRRAATRQPLLSAHRDHVYQRLTAAGRPHLRVAVAVAGVALVCCLVVLVLPGWASLPGLGAVVVGYLASPRVLAARGTAVGAAT